MSTTPTSEYSVLVTLTPSPNQVCHWHFLPTLEWVREFQKTHPNPEIEERVDCFYDTKDSSLLTKNIWYLNRRVLYTNGEQIDDRNSVSSLDDISDEEEEGEWLLKVGTRVESGKVDFTFHRGDAAQRYLREQFNFKFNELKSIPVATVRYVRHTHTLDDGTSICLDVPHIHGSYSILGTWKGIVKQETYPSCLDSTSLQPARSKVVELFYQRRSVTPYYNLLEDLGAIAPIYTEQRFFKYDPLSATQ